MPLSEATTLMVLKFIGGALGTLMSFAFVPVNTWKAFAIRVGVSLPSGFVFADALRDLLHLAATIENSIAGGLLAGLLSWVVFGAIIRLLQNVTWADLPWPFKKK